MGIIQSAVNQALGTVGTVAGIGKAFKLKQKAESDQNVLDLIKQQKQNGSDEAAAKNEEAMVEAAAKNELKAIQSRQSQEFEKKFLEGVNTMKGVRSVTTFGADTGEPYLRSRTVYTPRGEEAK